MPLSLGECNVLSFFNSFLYPCCFHIIFQNTSRIHFIFVTIRMLNSCKQTSTFFHDQCSKYADLLNSYLLFFLKIILIPLKEICNYFHFNNLNFVVVFQLYSSCQLLEDLINTYLSQRIVNQMHQKLFGLTTLSIKLYTFFLNRSILQSYARTFSL